MDNDEFTDVFVKRDGRDCAWYRNVSYGAAWGYRPITDSEYVIDISPADIDGDGDLDFFASTSWNPEKGFVWYERLSQGGNQWETHLIAEENVPAQVYAADMDGDQDSDLVAVFDGEYPSSKKLAWWENTGNGTSWTKHLIGEVPAWSMEVADLDVDGDPDVICGTLSDSIHIYINGVGDSWTHVSVGYGAEGNLMQTSFADIDSDGLPDIVSCPFYHSSDVVWFRNTGDPTNWQLYTITTSEEKSLFTHAADMNRDDNPDICFVSYSGYSSQNILWLENVDPLNGVWTEHALYQDSAATHTFGDMNLDGILDVVACYRDSSNPNLNEAYWWNMSPGYYQGETYLESSKLYVYDVEWGSIDWSAVTPAGTSVSFQVRSSDDPSDLGEWSANLTSPCSLAPYLTTGDSYVQYRAILATDDPEQTPVLESVSLSWTSTGIEGSEEPEVFSLEVLENPASGSVVLGIILPDTVEPVVFVFDTAGRLVETVSTGELPAGFSTVMIDHLRTGTYFCRVQAEGAEAVERFAVLQE